MARYRIEFDRPNCAGYGNCCSVCPQFWQMQADKKSSVKGGTKRADGWEVLEIPEEDLPGNRDAAFSCPVNAIHIVKLASAERLI